MANAGEKGDTPAMQTACSNQLCLPARCVRLDGEEMTYVTGGSGLSTTIPIRGLLPDFFRRYALSITFSLSWDGKGLMEDFPEIRSQLSKLFPLTINFKFE